MSKPNILLIMSDEHTAAVTGCYGDPVVQTPHLDALAADGIRLDSCYTACPLCVPSRSAFLTGRYVSHCKAWSNGTAIADDAPDTLPRLLAAAGYDTVLGGRMSLRADQRFGFAGDLMPEVNQGRAAGAFFRAAAGASDQNYGGRRRYQRLFDTCGPTDDNRHLQQDRTVTERCSELLREHGRGARRQPLFLTAGYYLPHFPFAVPERWVAPYRGRVPDPQLPSGLIESLPYNYQMLRRHFEVEEVPSELVTACRELYWGMVSWLDEQIGQLLAALDQSGLADDTLVIYTSDHGDNLGEHGLWRKNSMYEASARVPAIVRWPGRWHSGEERGAACAMLDIAATLVDVAGGEVPARWGGRPLTGGLDDPAAVWPDLAVSEYYGHNVASGYAMVRRGRYKYVYFTAADADHPAERQLFDLADDPSELHDLAGDEQHAPLLAELHRLLTERIGRDPEQVEAEVRGVQAEASG